MHKELNKEEVFEYYQNHTFKATYQHFNMCEKSLTKYFNRNGLQKRSRSYNISDEKRKERKEKITQNLKLQYQDPEQKSILINNIRNTTIDRYGVENYVKTDESKKKTKQTNLLKYGVEYHTQTSEWSEWKSNFYMTRSEEDIQKSNNKRATTMIEKYGVEWFCMHPDSRNKNKKNSKPNLEFKQLLEENGFIIDEKENREFPLNNFQYDFKINNILIEINPTTTHNSTFGLYNSKPLSKYYHYNKTKNALDNGYKCIQVFDWMDKQKVIDLIKTDFTQEFIGIQRYLYNLKTNDYKISNENLPEKSWPWVEIFDDGFKIIKL